MGLVTLPPARQVVKPRPWNFNPKRVEPRWRPLHAHATILAPMWGGGGGPLDYVARERATVDGQTWTVAPRGLGTRRTTNAADLYWAADPRHAIDADVPFFALFHGHVESYDATAVFLSRRSSFSAGYWVLFRSSDTGNPIKVGLYDGGTFDELTTSLTVGTGEVLIGFSRDIGGTYRVYCNGERDDVSGTRIPGVGTQVMNVGKVQVNTNANGVMGTYYQALIGKGWAPSDDHWQRLYRDPYAYIRPARRLWAFGSAGGTTIFVGLATETDTALGVGAAKDAAVGLATEADTGLSVGAAKSRTVGLASETDAAFGLTVAKALAVALTVETDSALAVTASVAVDVGLASEADSALGVGALKTVAFGLSTETDSALTVTPLTGTPVGLATETDAALAVSIAKALAVGLSEEADSAFEATPVRTIVLGQASEADTASALSALKSVTTGLAIETDAGLVVVASKSQAVGLALETDTSFAVVVEGVVVLFPITSKTGPALGGSMFGKATGGSMFGKALQE